VDGASNRVDLTGIVTDLGPLRHTPAGIAVIDFAIQHDSVMHEAGAPRQVSARIEAVAFDTLARLLSGAALGRAVRASGFLAARSRRSTRPVLHVTQLEFIEGD